MRKITLLVLTLFIISIASAQLVYEKDTTFNLKVPCEFNGTYCSASSQCNLTYISPDTTTLVNNEIMTNNLAYHNYTIVNTSDTGIYTATVACQDQGYSGIDTFEILITPNGEVASTGKSIVDLSMLFGLLLFFVFSVIGIFYVKDVRGKFALYWVTHLLAISISFIAWQSSYGILSANPFVGSLFRMIFYIVLIAFLPMFFVSLFYIIKYHFINKNVMELVNAGYDEEDAWRLAERSAKEL